MLDMSKNILGHILVLFVLSFSSVATARSLDDFLYDATRYGNTPERREAKRVARDELKERMPESLHAAMQYVHGDHVMLQVLVMEWVMEMPSGVIVPVLLEYVDHERVETRRVAIFFLGFHQTPEHSDRLFPHLEEEQTRGSVLRTLGKWKIPAARVHAEKWLDDGGERLRVVAANALRDIGDPAAIPALIQAFDDPVFTVRNTAARAVISMGEIAIPHLSIDDETRSPVAEKIRRRCLVDLNAKPVDDMMDDGVVVDGAFYLP